MNVRKMMARLNPATIRFDVGSGGTPELTSQDVAAALGMVRDDFARDVFTAIWWPAGAALSAQDLLHRIRDKLLAEYSARCRECEIAKLELHIGQAEFAARRVHKDEDRRELSRLEARANSATRHRWPSEMTVYPKIAYAVLAELAKHPLCERCQGHGQVLDHGLVRACPRCEGRCIEHDHDARRAMMLDKERSAYVKTWKPVYEWLFEVVSSAESDAARDVAHALARDERAAA